jgi:D-alanyl-D-alanine carboxypeptidase
MVLFLNTDIEYEGSEPSTTLATAITKELTPDHIYTLGAEIQAPDVEPSPTPTTKPRCSMMSTSTTHMEDRVAPQRRCK